MDVHGSVPRGPKANLFVVFQDGTSLMPRSSASGPPPDLKDLHFELSEPRDGLKVLFLNLSGPGKFKINTFAGLWPVVSEGLVGASGLAWGHRVAWAA